MIDLRAERLNRGLSLGDAAKEIEVAVDTLARAESGERVPQPRNAFKIASFYGHKVTDIWPVDTDEQKVPA